MSKKFYLCFQDIVVVTFKVVLIRIFFLRYIIITIITVVKLFN